MQGPLFPFQVGDEVEQEWTVDKYQDTIHPVRILHVDHANERVTVKLLAYKTNHGKLSSVSTIPTQSSLCYW